MSDYKNTKFTIFPSAFGLSSSDGLDDLVFVERLDPNKKDDFLNGLKFAMRNEINKSNLSPSTKENCKKAVMDLTFDKISNMISKGEAREEEE